MRILLLSVKSDMPTGGIAVWTDCFISCCAEQNIDYDLINTDIIGRRRLTRKRNLWDECVRTYRIYTDLRKQLRQNRYDAVYLNTSCGTYGLFRDQFLASIVKRKHIPLITQYHCDISFWVQGKIRCLILKQLVRCSQVNLVLNKASQEFLTSHYHASAEVIPNFINSREIRSTAKEISPTITKALYVGQITESKGLRDLFSVAEQFPHITFNCAGIIRPICSQWKIPENVHLLGVIPHDQITYHLDSTDIFLFPSHTEGSSIAVLESLARGVPTIATDVGNHTELLSDGCGVIVPLHNVESIAEAIRQLNAPALRKSISQKSIARISQKYTQKNVDTIFDIIRKM